MTNTYLMTLLFTLGFSISVNAHQQKQYETDFLYRTIIETVQEVDFERMGSTYHPDAVIVTSKKSTPIKSVLKRWKKEGEQLEKDGGFARVKFRFLKRIVNETTSFESGIYRYSMVDKLGTEQVFYAHFEDLNVKKDGKWLTIMEHQTKSATEQEWNDLSDWN
ncbi:MAG: hypothetical protein HRT52_04355 [Colwellia sp.]|nr:hypothetical protein [Colwellia sp.]